MAAESVCEKCGGTGWIIVERAYVTGAEACGCRNEGRAERLEDRAQIPPLYRGASFENFVAPADPFNGPRQELRDKWFTVQRYAEEFPLASRPGLLLIGEAGTGKTHLAVAALRKILAKGFEGVFCDYQNLLDRIRSGYDATSNSSDRQAYRMALDSDVLLLDDLGAHRVTDWVQDTITSIITYRGNHKKPLIATTNLPDVAAGCDVMQKSPLGTMEYRDNLAKYIGERARSRLFEMCTVIKMPAVDDYRLSRGRKF